jgi:hypothetical protein
MIFNILPAAETAPLDSLSPPPIYALLQARDQPSHPHPLPPFLLDPGERPPARSAPGGAETSKGQKERRQEPGGRDHPAAASSTISISSSVSPRGSQTRASISRSASDPGAEDASFRRSIAFAIHPLEASIFPAGLHLMQIYDSFTTEPQGWRSASTKQVGFGSKRSKAAKKVRFDQQHIA